MNSGEIMILVLVGVVILIVIAIWMAMRRRRTENLRADFGDEYDRTLDAKGDRAAAEADLADRKKRVDALDIRPLTVDERDTFAAEWHEVKAVFVDSPVESVLHADRLLAKMMSTRGFPMADFERRYEDLTVNHSDIARHYRTGHDVVVAQGNGNASTEDLRQAMKHYEALYDHLVSEVEERHIDRDGDGVDDRVERSRDHDRDRDGVDDRVERGHDRDRDGIDDSRERGPARTGDGNITTSINGVDNGSGIASSGMTSRPANRD